MLLWEALAAERMARQTAGHATAEHVRLTRRLPFDKRCAAFKKDGRRCKCRRYKELETCLFHDPTFREQMRIRMQDRRIVLRRRLSHIPDGYLRKLSNRASVTNAMDRLYREVRLGTVTPAMGDVLFEILSRLLDSGLLDVDKGKAAPSRVTKVDKLRLRMREVLTRGERSAWRRVVAEAPEAYLLTDNGKQALMLPGPGETPVKAEVKRVRQAAS